VTVVSALGRMEDVYF